MTIPRQIAFAAIFRFRHVFFSAINQQTRLQVVSTDNL